MTQDKKQLLLQDLCARLPYGVKAYVKNWSKLDRKYYEDIYDVKSVFPSLNEVHVQSENGSLDVLLGHVDYKIKPYLFPLSSMTEEQKREYNFWKHEVFICHYEYGDVVEEIELYDSPESFEYLIENHFDYRGLIPKGLAIDATGKNIY